MKCVYHQKNKFSSKIALRSIIVNLSRSLSFQNALRMEKAAAVGKVKKYKTKKNTNQSMFSLNSKVAFMFFCISEFFCNISFFSEIFFYFLVEWCSIAEVNNASSEKKSSEESEEVYFFTLIEK